MTSSQTVCTKLTAAQRQNVTSCGPRTSPEWPMKPLVAHNINKLHGSILVRFNKEISLWHFSEVTCVWVTLKYWWRSSISIFIQIGQKIMKTDLCPYGKHTAVTERIFMKLITEWRYYRYVYISRAEFVIKSVTKCGHYEWKIMRCHNQSWPRHLQHGFSRNSRLLHRKKVNIPNARNDINRSRKTENTGRNIFTPFRKL